MRFEPRLAGVPLKQAEPRDTPSCAVDCALSATISAVLDALEEAVLVLDEGGRLVAANALGRKMMSDPEQLARARRKHVDCISPSGRRSLELLRGSRSQTPTIDQHPLTRRQMDVLTFVLRGLSNKEIAVALGCAENTVEYHVTRLLRRYRVDSRAKLAARVLGL